MSVVWRLSDSTTFNKCVNSLVMLRVETIEQKGGEIMKDDLIIYSMWILYH